MIDWIIYAMVYLGSALMVLNIYCFARYIRYVHQIRAGNRDNRVLYLPVVLLVMFLLGYLAIGIIGNPDLIVAGVLFSGSVFVFIMYRLLNSITHQIVESERMEAEFIAAEKSNRAKTAFLATISHEMRTPMNVILGLDDIALKDPDVPERTRCQLEQIGQSGRHLLGMINNILDLNRVETGTLTVDCQPFDLADALAQIDAVAGALCKEKGLQYSSYAQEGALQWYMGDQAQLQRALLCLLDNAAKYTDAPGSVAFSVERAGGNLTFTVRDTGIGMDEAYLARCFELFSQEDDSFTSRHGGSGLGLPITKSIIDCMGGTVTATSKPGVGSVFTVTVPLEVAEAPAPLEEPTDALPPLEGKRILIAEDIDENAEIVADLLELEGAESERAENGRIALEMIEGRPEGYYDAVLMDLRMPEMDGLTATKRIRQLDRGDAKRLPIIALTANAAEIDVQHSLEAGMNAHLSKPADAELLYNTLRQAIGASRVSKERGAS